MNLPLSAVCAWRPQSLTHQVFRHSRRSRGILDRRHCHQHRLLQQLRPIPEQHPHGRQLRIHDCPQRHIHLQIRRIMNSRPTSDDDSGVVVLEGEFVTFKGHRHVRRYRFVNLQEALDGSTVLALWPPIDLSQIDSNRDTEYLTRPAKK